MAQSVSSLREFYRALVRKGLEHEPVADAEAVAAALDRWDAWRDPMKKCAKCQTLKKTCPAGKKKLGGGMAMPYPPKKTK